VQRGPSCTPCELRAGTAADNRRQRAPGKWIDFSLFGHQIVCHWVGKDYKAPEFYNPVGGDEVSPPLGRVLSDGEAERAMTPRMLARCQVPVPHFGIVLDQERFHDLAKRVESAGIAFVIPVRLRRVHRYLRLSLIARLRMAAADAAIQGAAGGAVDHVL
jgi:extradiol dioxygenase family protein